MIDSPIPICPPDPRGVRLRGLAVILVVPSRYGDKAGCVESLRISYATSASANAEYADLDPDVNVSQSSRVDANNLTT